MTNEHRKEYQREYQRKYYHKNKEREQERKQQWYASHPTYLRSYAQRRNIRLRQNAIRLLGGACAHCHCTDMRCLEIDHIIPVGSKKRVHRDILHRSILRGNTDNLQVLCACCHAIKTYKSYYGYSD